ncbi:MAG: hypothetical protein GWN58_10655 [Anaerolineae bacterium]|nr:hypothetical protein [Anaerolineae bacterium]
MLLLQAVWSGMVWAASARVGSAELKAASAEYELLQATERHVRHNAQKERDQAMQLLAWYRNNHGDPPMGSNERRMLYRDWIRAAAQPGDWDSPAGGSHGAVSEPREGVA